MESDNTLQEEPKDYTKLIWAGVAVMLTLMVLGIWWTGRPSPDESLVYTRHILVSFNPHDQADRRRAYTLARDLRERILAGESFSKLAGDYSNDDQSSSRGGKLPPFGKRDQLEAQFSEFAWNAPIGTLSDIITTSYGYHLIIVDDRHLTEADKYNAELHRRAMEEAGGGRAATTPPEQPGANTCALSPAP